MTSNTAAIRRKDRILVACIISGVVIICSVFLVFAFGKITGSEFSPETFQRREFSYYEIPVMHVQVSPISRTIQPDTTSAYLQAKQLLPVQTTSQWHLDWLLRRSGHSYGDARLLCQYLDIPGVAAPFWQGWSVDHPEAAKVLWPRVQELAMAELYVLLPDLFDAAQTAPDATALAGALNENIAMRLEFLANQQKAAGKGGQAAELAELGLKLIPNDHPRAPTLRKIRGENAPQAEANRDAGS